MLPESLPEITKKGTEPQYLTKVQLYITIRLFFCTNGMPLSKTHLVMNNLSLRVLLVDDDDEDRQLIRWALTSAIEQIIIEEMTSGQELIDWLAQQRRLSEEEIAVDAQSITIILLDMHMPKLTGLITLYYLGDMSDLPYMPVIMLTASISDQLKQQAYQRGIHLFMLKPAGANGFYRVVEAVKLCFRDVLRIREQQRLSNDFR